MDRRSFFAGERRRAAGCYGDAMEAWPEAAEDLVRVQEGLARLVPPAWHPAGSSIRVGACFVCFAPAGPAGERAWAAGALVERGRLPLTSLATGKVTRAYEPGLLALREGPLLEAAVRSLPEPPDVVLVNATGRDHPRRAGLALHLGAVLGVPTVGVTDRPLCARGDWPEDIRGASSLLLLEGDLVGYWLRTKRGVRPVAVHIGWRVEPAVAVDIVLRAARRARTPQPLRVARMVARRARGAELRRSLPVA
ncbi:MAG TPA: endonuclease V [Actinomycetota bacterium]